MKKNVIFILIMATLFAMSTYSEENSGEDEDGGDNPVIEEEDGGKEAKIEQPSFVENGGALKKHESAVIIYLDAGLLPPGIMVGYRFGIFNWWDIGFDVGGDYGVFQVLLHTKMEIMKTRKTEFFFWDMRYQTGYKYHRVDLTDNLIFDDKSWVHIIENSFAFRLGKKRNKVIYLNTQFYIDKDLSDYDRQTDYYVTPLTLGYEMMIKEKMNFFIQAGYTYGITGMETHAGLKYKKDWFVSGKIGFAFRFGGEKAKGSEKD